MSNLLGFYEIIEKGIDSLGIPPTNARGQEAGQWDFNRGSAIIAVGIISSDRFPNGYFYVSSILMNVDDVPSEKKEDFYKRLCEMNASLVNMKLCVAENQVQLISNRDAIGLDVVEVETTINSLSYYADLLDDMLKESFI
jgi:hypothetical protein